MKKILCILILISLVLTLTLTTSKGQALTADTTLFTEGFEGAWPGSWSIGDLDSNSGLDYWGDNPYSAHGGSWSGWCADTGVQTATTTILSETFEGAFPGSATVGDWNSANGLDYWDDTSYRAHGGSWSGWSAQVGNKQTTVTIFTEGFEGAWPGSWIVGDWNTGILCGSDYWGDNSHRSYSGSWSGWCADEGTQREFPWPNNRDVYKYDDEMSAYMYRNVALGSYSSVSLSYKYWINCEPNYDFVGVLYYQGGSWYYIDSHTGNSGGWQSSSASIPTSVTAVGFYFFSDNSVHTYEGAYVDDVVLTATTITPNYSDHQYDDSMEAYMYRPASLSSYSSVSLSYYYWINSESGWDYLDVMYLSGTTWTYIDRHTGNSNGWQSSTVTIPNYATQVGFYFRSDSSVHSYEGAYIDDVTLTGITEMPNSNLHNYDNNQDSYMYWSVDLNSYASVWLSYWYRVNCESGFDYLQVMYYSGGAWNYIDTHTGNSGAWQSSTATIPTTASYVGFIFHSDSTVANYEGAYVDDIFLQGNMYNVNAHKYDGNMQAYMHRPVSLGGYASVWLSYWYRVNCESGFDYLQVMYYSGGAWNYIDTHTGNSGAWQFSNVSIPTTATLVGFYFHSDSTVQDLEGAYLDDIDCSGKTPPTYNVTITAYCTTDSIPLSVSITMDGSPTGYNTPHTFTGLTGTHTFTVPTSDPSSHPFKQWSTGSTNRTITVNSGGTYTAYYELPPQSPSIQIWLNKTAWHIGERMNVYVHVRNPGPAVYVRANITLQLSNGALYPLLNMLTTIPAGYDSGEVLWQSFTIPTAPYGNYVWIAELRNPTTGALIMQSTYSWQLVP